MQIASSLKPEQPNMRSSDPPGSAPLKPNVFLILLALVEGQAHGYEIRKNIERRSESSVRLDPGTLYRHLGRLLDEGLIEESRRRPSDDDPRRRYYRLTATGIGAIEGEAERMASLVTAVRARKLTRSASGAR